MISARAGRDEQPRVFPREDDPHDGVETWLNVSTTSRDTSRAPAPHRTVEKTHRLPRVLTILCMGFVAYAAVIAARSVIDAFVAPGDGGDGPIRTAEVIPETSDSARSPGGQPGASNTAAVDTPALPAAAGAPDGSDASTRVKTAEPQVTRKIARAKSRRQDASVRRRERASVDANVRAPFAHDPKGNL